ncbi:hypothetical protein BC830DRAFT_1133369 [Chytriomyces sp. MP71]|nr:hypothetical protein BC830DRAFT_1133369 [Chytriomyces sp. MP71]
MSSAIPKYLASKQTRVRKQQFTSFSAPDTTPPSEPDLTGRELLLHFQQELSFLNMRLFELEEENERVQRRYGLPALVIHT